MKIKRLIALIMAMTILFAMSACSKNDEVVEPSPTTTPTVTPEPEITTPAPTTEPEPEWEPGIVRASYVGGLLKLLQRGDEVTVLGEWEDYFIIEGDDMPLLVEKQFLRPETEEAPAETQGYAKSQTPMYTTAYLRGEAASALELNTRVTVLDTKGDWALIRLDDGTEGYVSAENISKWYIGGDSGNSGNSGGGGNSGNSGNSGGGGNSGDGAQDGTDVFLGNISYSGGTFKVELLSNIQQPEYEEYEMPVSGLILSADTEVYAYMFMREDELKVTDVIEATEEKEATCIVWINDLFVAVPRWALWMEGDEIYEAWTAYGRSGGIAYTEIQMWHEMISVRVNQRIEVVDELTEIGMYVIRVDDSYGYISMSKLSTTEYVAPSNNGNGGNSGGGNSGGGNSGGGNSGGNNSGGGDSGGTGWTPPML